MKTNGSHAGRAGRAPAPWPKNVFLKCTCLAKLAEIFDCSTGLELKIRGNTPADGRWFVGAQLEWVSLTKGLPLWYYSFCGVLFLCTQYKWAPLHRLPCALRPSIPSTSVLNCRGHCGEQKSVQSSVSLTVGGIRQNIVESFNPSFLKKKKNLFFYFFFLIMPDLTQWNKHTWIIILAHVTRKRKVAWCC